MFIFVFLIAVLIPPTAWGAEMQVKVVAENAVSRAAPDLESDIIDPSIPLGAVLDAVKKIGDWYEISRRTNLGVMYTCYIHSSHVTVVGERPTETLPETKPAPVQRPAYIPVAKGKSFMSVYINGGISLVGPDDLNQVINGYGDYWSEADDIFTWGEIKMMSEIGGELIFNLTENIGIGVGAGYIFKNSRGEYGTTADTLLQEFKFSFIPLTGSLHYKIPFGSAMNISLQGGAGYYLGKMKHSYNSGSTSTLEDASCNTLGIHAGIGIEIGMGSSAAIVITGLYRIANFKEWTGTRGGTEGKLYLYEWYSSYYDEYFPAVWIYGTPPTASARLAEINISGPVLKVGFKIGF